MPYIKHEDRKKYDYLIHQINRALSESPDGDVNYVITCLIDRHFTGGYTVMARGIATLECAKLEFYRKRLAPYEDEKRYENGEVYT